MRIEAPEVDEFLEDDRSGEADDLAMYALGPDERASVRVLIIDDETSICESCESVLKAEGYTCDVDGRAEDALRRLKGQPYDIVMIDQNMPVVHGLDILLEVRQRSPATLPIMMTGNATMEASIRAMQAGAFEYLPKPFTATQLLVVIGRAAYQLLKVRQLSGSSNQDGVLVDRGDLKMINATLKEMRYSFLVFSPYRTIRKLQADMAEIGAPPSGILGGRRVRLSSPATSMGMVTATLQERIVVTVSYIRQPSVNFTGVRTWSGRNSESPHCGESLRFISRYTYGFRLKRTIEATGFLPPGRLWMSSQGKL